MHSLLIRWPLSTRSYSPLRCLRIARRPRRMSVEDRVRLMFSARMTAACVHTAQEACVRSRADHVADQQSPTRASHNFLLSGTGAHVALHVLNSVSNTHFSLYNFRISAYYSNCLMARIARLIQHIYYFIMPKHFIRLGASVVSLHRESVGASA